MPLPVVLGSAGTLLICFDRDRDHFTNALTKKMDIPNARNRIYTASFTYTVYTVYKTLCPNADAWKDKSQLQK
jgi:hypothetical protein